MVCFNPEDFTRETELVVGNSRIFFWNDVCFIEPLKRAFLHIYQLVCDKDAEVSYVCTDGRFWDKAAYSQKTP